MDTPGDVARRRLTAQRWDGEQAASPDEAVRLLLAVQSQEHGFALWAACARSGAAVADADAAFADARFVRTHVLRPTWHFVHRDDLRWLMAATAHRVHKFNAYYNKQHHVDDDAVAIARRVADDVLADRHLTRAQLATEFAAAGVTATGIGLGLLMMRLELDLVVCSGVPRGKQQTYALVDERVPAAGPDLDGDDALGELAARYVAGHGPATPKDLAWWATMTLGDARRAFAAAGERVVREEAGGVEYWVAPGTPRAVTHDGPVAHLVPQFDEIVVGYGANGSRAVMNGAGVEVPRDTNRSYHPVLVDGQLVGFWNRVARRREVEVTVTPVAGGAAPAPGAAPTALPAPGHDAAVDAAVERYGAHLGVPVSRARA